MAQAPTLPTAYRAGPGGDAAARGRGAGAAGAGTGRSSLTTRGRAFLAAGLAMLGCALFLGQSDLLRVAILLLALPALTAVVVARTRYKIAASRSLDPPRIPVGRTATVRILLENGGRTPTGQLLLEDQVPLPLSARPRFVLDRHGGRWQREITYPVRSESRGRFAIGPLTLRVADPFGLVEFTRSFRSRDTLLVTPEVVPLPTARLPGEWSILGNSHRQVVASDGEEDVSVREYRDGDPLRRVHWRSTARRGELMVRREERRQRNRATVFLDSRLFAHRGSGPLSSFEWAVHAAASVAIHLLHRGFAVRIATAGAESVSVDPFDTSSGSASEAVLLDLLACVELAPVESLAQVPLCREVGAAHGLVVGVFGQLGPADAAAAERLGQTAAAPLAIALDIASWTAAPGPATATATAGAAGAAGAAGQPGGPARDPADGPAEAGIRILRGGGWRVATANAGTAVGSLWQELLTTGRDPRPFRAERAPATAGPARSARPAGTFGAARPATTTTVRRSR